VNGSFLLSCFSSGHALASPHWNTHSTPSNAVHLLPCKKKALCVSHHILVYHSTDLPCICCVPLRIVKYSLASPIAPILASSTHPNSGLYILANQSFKRPTSNLSAGRTTKSLSGQVLASYPPCAGPSTSASQAAKPSRTRHRSRARDRGSR